MKGNNKLGAVLAIIGILAGLLVFYLFAGQYNLVIDTKTAAGRTDEATSVTITYAVLGWIGIPPGQSGRQFCTFFLGQGEMGMVLGSGRRDHPIAGWLLPHDPRHGQWTADAHDVVFLAGGCHVVRNALHRRREREDHHADIHRGTGVRADLH